MLTVCATDAAIDASENTPANEKRSECVLATITIRNVNEHLPTFKQSLYRIEISERAPAGLEVFRFTATDSDNTPVLYR